MSSGGSGSTISSGSFLDLLPDELLIQIFGHLAVVGSTWEEDDPLRLSRLPYRQSDLELLPCTGLRGYPFLAQVCRKWKRLLGTPMAQHLIWRRVCIDLGHELITSIHTPLRWSNQRPTTAEYNQAFQTKTISAGKVLHFLGGVAPHVTSLAIANSEGFEADDGEYVPLADKHNFGPSHLGFALALVRNTLTLVVYRCNDLVTADAGVWTLASQLPCLRTLAVEGLRALLPEGHVAPLGELSKLESLTLTGDEFRSDWGVGLEAIPASWSRLTALTRLELRGHSLLPELPPWLAAGGKPDPRSGMPGLRHLDISGCGALELAPLTRLTGLHVLVLQNLALDHVLPSPAEVAAAAQADQQLARRALPDLQPLAPSLRSLSLSNNRFTRLPVWLHRLTRLEHLDVAYNRDLHIRSSLTPSLSSLPHLALLDFRSVHVTKDKSYWCEAKCTTMQHLSKLAKALKRRCPQPRLLMDI
ncbi:hypothetical protein PLESTB_001761600 [Pleodorina starrii]|uniref:Uncharacterized protein n=1 Tax=Pleodorina starrii TaxID=330485 RepID=A0A9W6F9M2_9CHLO|nr:hypothetical protein PLESTB_001761600 [Pleodorina starrii]